ncbi:hypothetical protein U1707_15445 [Sphingomonas sp. PB2P12]|uniref:hypothetical protein n=1 Tax=Sphingomonas sandaracina TaxID=3096157 RepID=UPI002FC6ABC2
MMGIVGPRKSFEWSADNAQHSLAKTPNWPHLTALGVGAVVGTGTILGWLYLLASLPTPCSSGS